MFRTEFGVPYNEDNEQYDDNNGQNYDENHQEEEDWVVGDGRMQWIGLWWWVANGQAIGFVGRTLGELRIGSARRTVIVVGRATLEAGEVTGAAELLVIRCVGRWWLFGENRHIFVCVASQWGWCGFRRRCGTGFRGCWCCLGQHKGAFGTCRVATTFVSECVLQTLWNEYRLGQLNID